MESGDKRMIFENEFANPAGRRDVRYTSTVISQTTAVTPAPASANRGGGNRSFFRRVFIRTYRSAVSCACRRISAEVTPLRTASSRTMKIASSKIFGSGDFMIMTLRVTPLTISHHAPITICFQFALFQSSVYRSAWN